MPFIIGKSGKGGTGTGTILWENFTPTPSNEDNIDTDKTIDEMENNDETVSTS